MALSFESSSSATPAVTGTSLTWSHTVTSATFLVADLGAGDSTLAQRSATACTYNAVSFGSAWGVSDDGNFERIEVWKLASPAAGAHNMVATWANAAATQLSAGVSGYIGADLASFNTPTANTATATTATTGAISSATGEIVHGAIASDADVSITEDGTLNWERQAVDADSCFGAQRKNGAASVTLNWTQNASFKYAAIAVSIKAASTSAALIEDERATVPAYDDDWLVSVFR